MKVYVWWVAVMWVSMHTLTMVAKIAAFTREGAAQDPKARMGGGVIVLPFLVALWYVVLGAKP